MIDDKNRIPLNEEKLEGVSGGIGGAAPFIVPSWASGDIRRNEACPFCLKEGKTGIKGKIVNFIVFEDSDTKQVGQVYFECPTGHTWYEYVNGDSPS